MENVYYVAIYDILQDTYPHDRASIALHQLKDRTVRVHSTRQVFPDNSEHDRIVGEEPTLYHILKRRRRQESRMINSVHGSNGNKHISTMDILSTFTTFMRSKYDDNTPSLAEFCLYSDISYWMTSFLMNNNHSQATPEQWSTKDFNVQVIDTYSWTTVWLDWEYIKNGLFTHRSNFCVNLCII